MKVASCNGKTKIQIGAKSSYLWWLFLFYNAGTAKSILELFNGVFAIMARPVCYGAVV